MDILNHFSDDLRSIGIIATFALLICITAEVKRILLAHPLAKAKDEREIKFVIFVLALISVVRIGEEFLHNAIPSILGVIILFYVRAEVVIVSRKIATVLVRLIIHYDRRKK